MFTDDAFELLHREQMGVTTNKLFGVVVPMPTFPPEVCKDKVLPAPKSIVEALVPVIASVVKVRDAYACVLKDRTKTKTKILNIFLDIFLESSKIKLVI